MLSFNFDYHYQVYLDKVYQLTSSLTIKSAKTALEVNEAYLVKKGVSVDSNDMTKWPYYCHISGEYSPYDEPIYITSIDTLEKIVFNQDNLKFHKNTAIAYQYNSDKYLSLIKKYPDKEDLIKGVILPCDKTYAINAPDGTILTHDPRMVEVNEYSLMYELQEWVNSVWDAWYQKQYNIDNRFYHVTFMGILYSKLPEAIMTIRLGKCKTNEAHSYHYRRYLASHGFLDFYLDQLTVKQAILFYLNILWVEKNVGQQETARWLVDKIFTLRNIPAGVYQYLPQMPKLDESLAPIVSFEKIPLNNLEFTNKGIDTRTLEDIYKLEENEAVLNPSIKEKSLPIAQEQLERSKASKLMTKVVTARYTDYQDSEKVLLSTIQLSDLIHMVKEGLYRTYATVTHPLNGAEYTLNGQDALMLMYAIVLKLAGSKVNDMPEFTATWVYNKNKSTIEELDGATPKSNYIATSWKERVIRTHERYIPVYSTIDFYQNTYRHFKDLNDMIRLVAHERHPRLRAYKAMMLYRIYHVEPVSLDTKDYKSVSEFLSYLNFDFTGLNEPLLYGLLADIWETVTGAHWVKKSNPRYILQAMVQLITKLSSYSVQYLGDMNLSRLTYMNNVQIRCDEGTTHILDYSKLYPKLFVEVLSQKLKVTEEHQSKRREVYQISTYNDKRILRGNVGIDVRHKVKTVIKDGGITRSRVGLRIKQDKNLVLPEGYPNIPGIETLLNLTGQERAKIKWDATIDTLKPVKG